MDVLKAGLWVAQLDTHTLGNLLQEPAFQFLLPLTDTETFLSPAL